MFSTFSSPDLTEAYIKIQLAFQFFVRSKSQRMHSTVSFDLLLPVESQRKIFLIISTSIADFLSCNSSAISRSSSGVIITII